MLGWRRGARVPSYGPPVPDQQSSAKLCGAVLSKRGYSFPAPQERKVHLRKMEIKERVKEKGILLGRARPLLLLHFLTPAVYFCLLL